MFLGQFYHNLDDKGRLTVPSRFREELASDGAYVMQGFERNLMVLPANTFEVVSHRIQKLSMTDPTARMLRRLLFSTADRVELDKSGRIAPIFTPISKVGYKCGGGWER
jgi:MraZ protein